MRIAACYTVFINSIESMALDNPFYYLENFEFVLNWVGQRYADMLDHEELAFIQQYWGLPRASRALLVRMVMRRGHLFRHSKLHYPEIGAADQALAPLVRAGWVDDRPALTLEQLFALFTKAEIHQGFGNAACVSTLPKKQMYSLLAEKHGKAACLVDWWPDARDQVHALLIMPLCERFRLMFFGNLRQDWSEFVLAELGLLRYETVDFPMSSRALGCRQDIDDYLYIQACFERLQTGESPHTVLADIHPHGYDNPWIERRRAKLLFRAGQACERLEQWDSAMHAYRTSTHAEARARLVRVLERSQQFGAALQAAESALRQPEDEAETQQLVRMLPRLRRKLGLAPPPRTKPRQPRTMMLQARPGQAAGGVEEFVRQSLHQADAPAYYVENMLVNALFGLLCWDVIFAPLPGAFFHPFQRAPADLHDQDFVRRRKQRFDACLGQLDSGRYIATIQNNFISKAGRQCSFVHWPALCAELIEQALDCIPALHLKNWFMRLLADIPGNRSGFPDLIQFWPNEKRYQMVEVKGPGDRLQDNQRRWLAHFAKHDMPAAVCFVRWAQTP